MVTPLTSPYVLTRYDSFSVIMFECPRAVELLAEYGLHCSSCALNEYDSVEIGVSRHGMTEEQMVEMLEEINEQLAKEWDEQHSKTTAAVK
jgi:hypothetical protein